MSLKMPLGVATFQQHLPKCLDTCSAGEATSHSDHCNRLKALVNQRVFRHRKRFGANSACILAGEMGGQVGPMVGDLAQVWILKTALVDGEGAQMIPQVGRKLTRDPEGAATSWRIHQVTDHGGLWELDVARGSRPVPRR